MYGVRYDVNWYGSGEVTLRLELRSTKAGIAPMMLEETIASFVPGTCWTPLLLDEKSYQEFGQPQAWRVTIWKAGQELSCSWMIGHLTLNVDRLNHSSRG